MWVAKQQQRRLVHSFFLDRPLRRGCAAAGLLWPVDCAAGGAGCRAQQRTPAIAGASCSSLRLPSFVAAAAVRAAATAPSCSCWRVRRRAPQHAAGALRRQQRRRRIGPADADVLVMNCARLLLVRAVAQLPPAAALRPLAASWCFFVARHVGKHAAHLTPQVMHVVVHGVGASAVLLLFFLDACLVGPAVRLGAPPPALLAAAAAC